MGEALRQCDLKCTVSLLDFFCIYYKDCRFTILKVVQKWFSFNYFLKKVKSDLLIRHFPLFLNKMSH